MSDKYILEIFKPSSHTDVLAAFHSSSVFPFNPVGSVVAPIAESKVYPEELVVSEIEQRYWEENGKIISKTMIFTQLRSQFSRNNKKFRR